MKNIEIINKLSCGDKSYNANDIVVCKHCRYYEGDLAKKLFGAAQCKCHDFYGVEEDFFCRDGEKPLTID